MNLITLLKGVFSKMLGPKTVENVLHITPSISDAMKEAIELWEQMYMDKSPWLTENIKSANLASLIASEKARTATLEMEIKITGENERAKFISEQFLKTLLHIREQLEYGVALGGFVIKPYVTLGPYGKYVIEFNYTKASDFYPLSFSPEGKITEAAFIDRIITKSAIYSKVEYHKLEGTTLTIKNMAFKSSNAPTNTISSSSELGEPISLATIPSWASLSEEIKLANCDRLLFAYFRMPEANTVDLNSPLGVSGFSRAIDLIKHADEIYSDLLWELEGSQLAVDVDRTAFNYTKDIHGKTIETLPKLQERLFRRSADLGDDDTYNVFSPSIRDASIINALNTQLMRIEDVCAISRGTLSVVTTAEARTATELKILKQRSYAANLDIQKELENTLRAVLTIIDKYCDLYEIVPSGEYEASFKWDDSLIVDKDSERERDLLDLDAGVLSKVEYRMKWMGETRKQAEESLKAIQDEKLAEMQATQSIMQSFEQPQQDNGQAKSEAQESYDKKVRANESRETTTKKSNASK